MSVKVFVTFPSTSLTLVMSLLVRGLCDISKTYARTHTHMCSRSSLQWKRRNTVLVTWLWHLLHKSLLSKRADRKQEPRGWNDNYVTLLSIDIFYIKDMFTYKSILESGIHSNVPVCHALSQSPEVNKKYTVLKTEFDVSIKTNHAVTPSRSAFSTYLHMSHRVIFIFQQFLCCPLLTKLYVFHWLILPFDYRKNK